MDKMSPFVRRMNALLGVGATSDVSQIEARLAQMMGADSARSYMSALEMFNQNAMGGRARLVMTGATDAAVPGLVMRANGRNITLPVYDAQSRLGTWGSHSYTIRGVGEIGADGKITRMSGMDYFTQRLRGIKASSESEGATLLSRLNNSMRSKLGFHFRTQAGGGAAPFFRGDIYRINAKEGTELGALAREVAMQRSRAVTVMDGLAPTSLTAERRLVAFDALRKAQEAQAKILEILTEQGFSAASKVTVNSKGTVIRATTVPGGAYGTNLIYRAHKGPHHQAETELLLAEKLEHSRLGSRTVPYLMPTVASDYMNVARGVARMRGISPSSQVVLNAPIRLAGLMPKAGLTPEQMGRVEAMLQLLMGDSGVLAAGKYAQSIINQGFAYTSRERVITAAGRGATAEWAVGEHLGQFVGKPGIYNVNITAEDVVNANRNKLSGLSKAQRAAAQQELSVVGHSLTSTGAVGRAVKLGRNEAITRVLVNETGMRLVISRGRRSTGARTSGVGARMIMGGETRMTVAQNIGRLGAGGGYADFMVKLGAGGIPIQQLMFHNMAGRLAQTFKDGQAIGKQMMDVMSGILGGQTMELAPGQFSVAFDPEHIAGRPVQNVVNQLKRELGEKFGYTGFRLGNRNVNLTQLLSPDVKTLDQETAQLLASRLPKEMQAEAVDMLLNQVHRADFISTAAMRASQPGRGGTIQMRMQKLNLLAQQMGMGEALFGADESTQGMSGPAAKAAHLRNQARAWWRDFTAPTGRRNKAIRGLMTDFVMWGRGDDALLAHLKAQGRAGDIYTLDQFRQRVAAPARVSGRVLPHQALTSAFKKDRYGRHRPTTRSIILDLGAAHPQAMGAEEGLNRRYVVMPSGMAMGARTEEEMFARRSGRNATASSKMIAAQLELAQAAASGAPVEEIAAAAGRVNASIGERLLSKRGWVNRQLMSGQVGHQLAMVPDAKLAPGEIGITKRLAKSWGLDKSMIDRAKKSGIYGLTATDPAFSGVHVQLNRIRVIRRWGADKNTVFIHTGEAAARYRDFDADVMGVWVAKNRKQNQALKALFEYTGAADKAGLARQTHRDLLEAAGREVDPSWRSWAAGLRMPDVEAEIKGALVKDMTGTGTRVPYSLLRPYREVTMGVLAAHEKGHGAALWAQMGLSESVLSQQHVRKSIERMIAAKKASGNNLMEAVTAAERIVYGTLNTKKTGPAGSALAEQIVEGLLAYRTLPEGKFEEHSGKVGAMIEEIVKSHPQHARFAPGMGAEVAAALGSATRLVDAGVRSPISAFVSAGVGLQRGLGPIEAMLAQSDSLIGSLGGFAGGTSLASDRIVMGPGLGGTIGEAGREAAERAQRAGAGKFISETAKNLAESGKGLVGKILKSRAGKISLGLAGVAVMANLMRGSGGGGSGAPMPPEPMVNAPQDPGLQEFSQRDIRSAPIERVPGVRTHAQVTIRSDRRGPDMTGLGTDAFGRFGARVVQSGSFSDDMAPVEYRHQMEREIHRRMNSSF